MKNLRKIWSHILTFCILIFVITIYGCNESVTMNGEVASAYEDCDFLLLAKKHSITCFPGTCGKFEISILPGSELNSPIKLSVVADPCLNIKLSKSEITEDDLTADVCFITKQGYKDYLFTIYVKANYEGKEIQIPLTLEVIPWDKVVKEPK